MRLRPGASVIDHSAPDRAGNRRKELVKKSAAGWPSSISFVAERRRGATSDVVVFTQDLDEELTFDVRGYDYLLLLDVRRAPEEPGEVPGSPPRRSSTTRPRTVILNDAQHRVWHPAGDAPVSDSSTTGRPASSRSDAHRACSPSGPLRHLLVEAGLRIKEIRGVPAPFPKVLGNGFLGRTAIALNPAAHPRQQVRCSRIRSS